MKTEIILLDHGSGGELSDKLIKDVMLKAFDNPVLRKLGDGAVLDIGNRKMAFSTDSYVVDPIFFPGGSIGDLAVNGTVNDISMCGAEPLYLSVGFILEEGLTISDLEKIVDDMARAAEKAGVTIVTGDTKVVPKGAADKIFINTSGVGAVIGNNVIAEGLAKPGDKIIVSGTIADHGMTILTQREGLQFESQIQSDSAPLNHMVKKMLAVSDEISVLRDPTRGGVGTVLNEVAGFSGVGIDIFEESIPVRKEIAGVCELLGFDPLYVANEGKLLAFVSEKDAKQVLSVINNCEYGEDACIIGEVTDKHPGKVYMKTKIGGERIVHMLSGDQLPRIC